MINKILGSSITSDSIYSLFVKDLGNCFSWFNFSFILGLEYIVQL